MDPVTIIVPVKDEEAGLEYLLGDFRKSSLNELYEVRFIFIIDIRTSDASKKIASQFSDVIIDQKSTTGKGAAVKQAVDYWKNDTSPLVIFLDADGSYSFDSVISIIDVLKDGADVASGSRFISGGRRPEGMRQLHIFGNRILSMISSFRNRRKISDLCTGLWGFQEKALLQMDFKSEGFDLEAELAGLCRRNNLTHKETHVNWSQRKGGTSKLRSLTDGFIILLRIIRT